MSRWYCVVASFGVDLMDYSNLDQAKLADLKNEAANRAAALEAEDKKKKKKKKKTKKGKAATMKIQKLKVTS